MQHLRLAPAPVTEYIAPPAAVFYPSFYPSFSQLDEVVTDLVNPQISFTVDEISQEQVVGQEIPDVYVLERIQEQSAVPDLVTSVEASQVVDSVPLLPAMEYIAPASPVTDELLNQPLPPAFTSFLELLTEQVVAAPSPQDAKEVVSATVNKLITAAPADELAPDVELDEARQRIKLRRVFDAALAERTAQELRPSQLEAQPPKRRRRAGTKSELWTVYELALRVHTRGGQCTRWHDRLQ